MNKTINGEMIGLIAIMSLGVLSVGILSPVLPLYLTSIRITPEILGLIFSVATVGMVIGETFWGWVADRVGVKLPLSMGTFVCALSVFSLVLTQNIAALFAVFFFWGLVRSAIFAPIRGYIGAKAPPLKKATFMAIVAVAMSAPRTLGALPSGFMADNWGYHSVFWASAGFALLAGLIMLAGLAKIPWRKSAPSTILPTSVGEPLFQYQKLGFRSFTPICLVTVLQFLGLGILMTFAPLLATQVVGVQATEVGILFAVFGLTGMALSIPMGMLADRFGKRMLMMLGLVVSAAAMMGIAFAQSFPWLVLFAVVYGLGTVMFTPAVLGLLSEMVPSHQQSTAMGLYGGLGENLGIVVGSALGGFAWSTLGPQPTFLIGALASGLGAVISFGLIGRGNSVRALNRR